MIECIKELFEGLSDSQKATTCFLVALCFIGVIRQLWLNLRYWITDKRFVKKFLKNASSYVEGFANNTDNNMAAQYVVRKHSAIYSLFGEDRVDLPECDLANSIRYENVHTTQKFDDIMRRLAVTSLEWDEQRLHTRWVMLIQLFVPVLFWLFRGIECFFILLAYLLNELGFKNVRAEGGLMHILSIIFTIVTGLASLFSYLGIGPWW